MTVESRFRQLRGNIRRVPVKGNLHLVLSQGEPVAVVFLQRHSLIGPAMESSGFRIRRVVERHGVAVREAIAVNSVICLFPQDKQGLSGAAEACGLMRDIQVLAAGGPDIVPVSFHP